MISIDLNNVKINPRLKYKLGEAPSFATYRPDFGRMYDVASRYADIENFIIMARGGSNTSFIAMYKALAHYVTTKKVYFMNTSDPDYTEYLKKKCPKDNTLCVVISKSGNTVDVLENMLSFKDYKKIVVTEGGALKEIAEKQGIEIIPHAPVGGRYSGISETGLLPACLMYMPIDKIFAGAHSMYERCHPSSKDNPALKLALALYSLDKKGFDEVYVPIYSHQLSKFVELIAQLMHETVCKEGKGQTFVVFDAPQCQHHTNQRFYGGKKNMCGLFIRANNYNHDEQVEVPEELEKIKLRDSTLKILKNPLSKTLEAEYKGNMKDATKKKIPNMTLTIDKITDESIGELVAFLQYLAVYSAWIRGVDAFDQPAVESAKELSFEERK